MSNPDSYFDSGNFECISDLWYYPTIRNGNENMEKKFYVMRPGNVDHKTYEDAEKEAKKNVAKTHNDYVIMQAVALAAAPIPDVSVTKL